MSAKPSKKNTRPTPTTPPPSPAAAPAPASQTAATASEPTSTFTPWIESTDPRKRALGKALLIGLWLYVAALCLLALDQTFNWGIFGPKIPPLP